MGNLVLDVWTLVDYISVSVTSVISILLLSYSIPSGALGLGSHADLLLSCSVITLALHNTIILIITHKSLSFNPKSTIIRYDRSSDRLIHWYRSIRALEDEGLLVRRQMQFCVPLEVGKVVGPDCYYMGIIDFQQQWTWSKRMERWLKVIVNGKDPGKYIATSICIYIYVFLYALCLQSAISNLCWSGASSKVFHLFLTSPSHTS